MFVIKLKNCASAVAALPFLLWVGAVSALTDVDSALTATPIGHEALQLRVTVLYALIVIGVIVVGVMFWSTLRHRRSKSADTKQFHSNAIIELIWIIIPILILVALALPASKTLIQRKKTGDSDMATEATGYQWKYPDAGDEPGTANHVSRQT